MRHRDISIGTWKFALSLSLSLFYQIPRFSKGNFRAEKGGWMIQHRARQPQLYSRFQMAESLTARAKNAP